MAGNPYWDKLVLGLHCDGTNGSTTITDVKGKTVTAGGNAQISTAQYPPLTGKTSSCYLDGTGDYLSIQDSADFHFAASDFSIRMWVRFSTVPGSGQYAALYSQRTDSASNESITVFYGGTEKFFVIFTSNGSSYTQTSTLNNTTPVANTWYCVETTRTGSNLDVYVGGTKGTAHNIGSSSLYNSTAEVVIGATGTSFLFPLHGYVSEIEIYKGVALHTSAYTPSSDPFGDGFLPAGSALVGVFGNVPSFGSAAALVRPQLFVNC